MADSIFLKMPLVVGARYFKLDLGKRFYFPLHNHEDFSEFLVIIDGEGLFQINGNLYKARSGHLLCYNRSIWQHSNDSAYNVTELPASSRQFRTS